MLATGAVAGCGSDISLLDAGAPSVAVAPLRSTTSKPVLRTVAYKPALGPPEDSGGQLTQQLNDAAAEEGIALVADEKLATDVTLRGYVTAMRKGASVNITYLWDVVDNRGQRVHRISGEETLAGGDAKHPWGAMTPAVSQRIAQRTISDLVRWVKSNPLPSPSAVAGGQGTVPSAAAGAGATTLAPTQSGGR